jgi:sarcosine oxidase subunit gamma
VSDPNVATGPNGLRVERATGARLFGCKGPHAADWLAAQGIVIPAAPNTWSAAADGAVVARLGTSEFFVGAGAAGGTAQRLAAARAAAAPAGVYPVLREDWAFTLAGEGAEALLAQVCNVDFAALDLAQAPVVMTLMVGVAVLVVPQAAATGRLYRIWCDPTYGPYLGSTLQGVVGECGGTYRGAIE